MPKKSNEVQEIYFGTDEFKSRYCVKPTTQALWRSKGMPFIRVPNSSKILYKIDDIESWLEKGKITEVKME